MATNPVGGGLKALVARPLRKELFLRLPKEKLKINSCGAIDTVITMNKYKDKQTLKTKDRRKNSR